MRNPGSLSPPLTLEALRRPHSSIARNHRLCEALFLARYIEKFGTGTLMMIRECTAHALPEPDFFAGEAEFMVTVWRDWLTDKVVAQIGLNARQRIAAAIFKRTGRITNAVYQQATGAARTSAKRDLEDLVAKGVLTRSGRGRGVGYSFVKNGPQSGQMGHPTARRNGP